jgi:hypothetical protein
MKQTIKNIIIGLFYDLEKPSFKESLPQIKVRSVVPKEQVDFNNFINNIYEQAKK